MLQLLQTLSWRHARRHRLRTVLTFFGICLGVSVIIAIAIVNRSLTTSFQRTIDQIAGKAVLQVSNAESGIPESVFPAIRDTPGVGDAAPAVDGFLPVTDREGERLYVYGVDFLTDSAIREHRFIGHGEEIERALDFIAQPDSIALTESFARRLHLPLGAEISLMTSRGRENYTVRAHLKEQGTARVFGGNFALMDLPVAQRAFGKEGRLDIVDLTVAESASIEMVQQRLGERLYGIAEVERPAKRGEQIEALLVSFRVGLFFVSLIALFVGFFLIYNTVSVSVVQRRRELGTLRCLGMRRGELMRFITVEALILALAGSLAGTVFGWFLAQGALAAVGETVGNLFSLVGVGGGGLSAREVAVAVASGTTVAVAAALYPAWEATQLSPLESATQAAWRPASRATGSRVMILGVVFFLATPTLLMLSPLGVGPVAQFSLGITAMLAFLLGLACFCPAIINHGVMWFWLSALRMPAYSWVEARLAADSLRRNPARAGMTVATLVISLAAIFTIATFVNSVRGSLLAWVDQMVTADLIVSSGARTAGPRNVPLSEDPALDFKSVPGVKLVDYYRLIRSTHRGKPIVIESFSARESAGVRNLPMAAGDGALALRELGEGRGVIVSESFQIRFNKKTGDSVELSTPSGPIAFKILGVYVDYSSDAGSVLLDRAMYKKYWRDDLVDAFDLWLEPHADQAEVIARIKQEYGERYTLFISTHRELREAVVRIMEQSFVVNYAVEIVAIIVAIFSVINTLLASILDRAREIGMLRAIGTTQAQIRKIVVMEAAWLGFLGGVLGLFAGTIMAYHHVVYNTKVLTGWTFQFYYPVEVAALCVVASVAVCMLAGYGPAKQAASTPIVTAIGYE